MAQFIGHLDTRVYEPGEFVLLQLFGYKTDMTGLRAQCIYAARGFITDFASIPAIFRVFISPTGASRHAAVIHDWLYCAQTMKRSEADAILLEALGVSGIGWLQRHAMYWAARAVGWIYWNRRIKNRMTRQFDFVPVEYWDEE